LDLKPVPVDELLDETTDLFRDRLELKHMQLEVRVENDLPPVLVDRENMKLALLNICINAIEAMEPEKGVLSIRASLDEHNQVIEVQDNGKGIAPEELDGLFEPFYTGKAGGMGLGPDHRPPAF
jgi:signal transduction histidine kinase